MIHLHTEGEKKTREREKKRNENVAGKIKDTQRHPDFVALKPVCNIRCDAHNCQNTHCSCS